jgi:hypothetical protein
MHDTGRVAVGVTYLVLALFVIVQDRRAVPGLLRDGFTAPYQELANEEPAPA